MKKLKCRKRPFLSFTVIFSILIAVVGLTQSDGRFFSASAQNSPASSSTPQPVRPKRRTNKEESRRGKNAIIDFKEQNPEAERSNLSRVLASVDFNLIGLVGTVSPATQAVPKNVPTAVSTSIQAPEGYDPAPIISGLNQNYRIRGELTGPSFTSPRVVEARIGQQLQIPAMPNAGDHVLQNLRIVDIGDPTGSTLAPVTPDSVGITVIDNILVTQVQVTEMTYEQIVQSGINLDSSNYNFFNFVVGLATTSGAVPIQIPVALPTATGQAPVVGNPVGGVGVGGVSVPPIDVVPVMLETVDEEGNPAPVEAPGGEGGALKIPGVLVFPGRIGLLHQFFEAIVIVSNGAPNGTPLVVTNLRAKAKLPDAGTPNNPGDDPLRIAATQQGGVQTQLEVHGLGPDGNYGTADDTLSFSPGQSGQAAFLLEGLKEGLHTVNFDLEGTLQGLPSGSVNIRGSVPGAVLVRDAEFGVTFTHPSVVRAGQEYELGLTVFNSGNRNLNGIALNLRGDSVSGATLIDSETKMLTQTIAPGNSGTVKWKLRSNTTGQVTASYIKVGDGISAGLNLVTGVGDRNVPLSPDSLILPDAVRHLPPDVTEAARQMLGQAWSVATAPGGSLPSGVLPVDKRTVVNKAVELGWAGLRIDFHEDRDTSLRTLLRDWLGEISANSSNGFADALRNTPAGYYFFDTVGTKFYQSVGTQSATDFHGALAAAESSRSAFISAHVSQPSGQQIFGAKLVSPTNQSVGFGGNATDRTGDLRTGALLNLLETDPHDSVNKTRGNLVLVSKPATSGNWGLEVNGWSSGSVDISILAPTTGKNYRQIVFSNVAVSPGKRYRVSFRASGTAAPVVEEFVDGAFRPAVLPYTSSDIADPDPVITGVVQITEDVIEGGDKYGRLIGVLFSKPMVKASAETLSRYQIGGGELVSDPTQVVGKLIKPTAAIQNFGGRFSMLALDMPVGPFIKRSVTANGIVDASGKIANSSTRDIEMRVSPRGNPPGGYLTGRVMQADGTPVPNAGVYYRRLKPNEMLEPGAKCGTFPLWETLSYQKADSNGEYAIDYVREGDCNPVTVLFQHTATNSEKTLVSNVAYNGQHLTFNSVFLARGNVQGTVTSGGIPLAEAYVSILSELDPLNNKLVKTNAQGFYSATGVPVGGVTVRVVGTGAYRLSSGIAAGSLNEAGGTATINVTTQNVSGVIKGRVLDSGNANAPVPNSLVVAKAFIPGFPNPEGPALPLTVGYAFTGPDGNFTIDKLPVGDVYVYAIDRERGVSASQTVQLTQQNPTAEGVTLLVSKGFGRVLGKVVNEIGQAIPNATVGGGMHIVQADEFGNYVLPGVREGNASITAKDPVTRHTGSTMISVRRNEDTTGADIVIKRPANLNGRVFLSQNGVDAPLAGAYVSDGSKIVRTDSQGRYTLSDVASGGNLTLRFVHPQGRSFVNTNVFLNPGETLSRNAVLKVGGRIHGKITQPDGVTPVLAGVSLKTVVPTMRPGPYFGLPEDAILSYQTGSDGLYAFENLNPVDYRISASNVFFPIPISQKGVLPSGADLEINLSLVDNLAGKIHGHIFQPDGVTPVGAGVRVSLGGGSLADATVRTNAEGYYEFGEVFSEGSYVLKAVDPLTNRTNQTTIGVKKNQDIQIDLSLLGRGNLKAKVLDGGGNPLQSGSITVKGANYPYDERYIELTPANNGEFEFANLTEGNYAVSALYQSLGGRVSGTVTLGGTTEVTVQIQAVGSVTGRVFMPDGATPVGLADVTLKQNGRIIGLITTEDSEEERGRFHFSYVPTGEFTIEIFDNRSGRRGRSAGTITSQGQISTLNVNLLALGTVVGQVTANGVPAGHALVSLSADGSGISGTSRVATTDDNGNFRFAGIPVGRVYVSVSNGPGGLTGQAQGFVSGTNEPLPDTIVNVALTPIAAVMGTVYKFGGGEPYSGALVRVTSNGFTVNTTTDSNGRYRVGFVPLGTVNVKVESPFGYDRGKSASIVSNQPGATIIADVTMAGVGGISGTATDAGGNALSFGRVTFTNYSENITVVAPVQSNGTYSMAGLPAGDFNLKLTVPEIIGVGTAVDTLTGEQSLVKNLALEPAGKIFGSVKSPDGTSPSIGADVILFLAKQGGGSYSFITHTDANGIWAVDNLPLGTASVRISDPNSGGVANLSGLNLNTNAQQLNAGTVTLDNTPIGVASVTPANNAVNVPTNSPVRIIFSEPVDTATINSGSVRLNFGNTPVGATPAISPDGTTVTLSPSQNLAETRTYSVIVTTQVRDRNGLALSDEFRSVFTTADQTPPSVSAISPANNSTEISLNSKVTVTASEPLDAAQNFSSSIQVSANNAAVAGTTALDQTGRVLEFTPSASLNDSTLYTITVNGLKDPSGNTQTAAFTSAFRSKDLTAPVVNPLPIDGTNIDAPRPTITASYQDNFSGVNPASVVFTLDGVQIASGLNASDQSVSYTPAQNLPLGSHTVTVKVADNAGNLSETRAATFTISDLTPPTVLSANPANNAQQVALNQVIAVQFSEPLDPNQNFASVLKVTELPQTTPKSGTFSLSGDGRTLSFTPTSLAAGKRHRVSVNGQKDVFGNIQATAFTSDFTTIDTVPPVLYDFYVDSRIAVDGLIVENQRPNFSIHFSDEIGIDENNTKLYLARQGTPLEAVAASVHQTSLSYRPIQPLAAGEYVTKVIATDTYGNQSSTGEITFTINPQQPELEGVIPYYGATTGNNVVTVRGRNLFSQFSVPNEAARGLLGEYYDRDRANDPLELKHVRTDGAINFDLLNETFTPYIARAGNETVTWRGRIIPRYSEEYTFTFELSGGVKIFIDESLVVNGAASNSVRSVSGTVALEAGRAHEIVIEHFPYYIYQGYQYGSYGNKHVAKLFWSSASQTSEIVPREQLRPAPQPIVPPVLFDGRPAIVVGAVSAYTDQIAVLTPPHEEGGVAVEVRKDGQPVSRPNAFNYYEDTNPPYARVVSPSGVSNIAPPNRISVGFEERLAADQNFGEILKVYKASDNGSPVAGNVTIDETGRRLTFVPSVPLAEDSRYRIGIVGQRDLAGNSYNFEQSDYFSTTDRSAPGIYITPVDQSTTVDRRPFINAYFSDELSSVDPNSAVMILDGADVTAQSQRYSSSIQYRPAAPLSFGTHSVTVRIADIAGNTAEKTTSFTVAPDTEPPIITSITIDGRAAVEGLRTRYRRPSISVYFQDNGPIEPAQQKLYFGPQGGQLALVPASAYYGGLFYSPPQDLAFGFYSARVELFDSAGNTTTRTITFEIVDLESVPPTVTSVSPANGASDVSGNTQIVVTFSEPLAPNQNFDDSMIVRNYQSSERVAGTFALGSDGRTLTFTPSQPLSSDARYSVTLYGYLDLADNPGVYFVSSFTTPDTVGPVLESKLFIGEEIELNNASIFSRTPEILIRYSDNLSGVDVSSLSLTLDGVVVTAQAEYYGARYTPPSPLALGTHAIIARIADNRGNTSQISGSFTVAADPRMPFAVEDDTLLLWHLDDFFDDCEGNQNARDSGPFGIDSDSCQSHSGIGVGRFASGSINPSLPALNDGVLAFGTNSFTIEGWLKYRFDADNPPAQPYLLWARGTNSVKEFTFALLPNGDLQARVFNAGGTVWETTLPRATFDAANGEWHSLAMVVERGSEEAQNQLKIYADGELRSTVQAPPVFGAVRTTATGKFKLGSDHTSPEVKIDEVRISGTARTAEQIHKNFDPQAMGLVVLRRLPAVLQRGAETDVTLEGYNLDEVSVAVTAADGSAVAATASVLGTQKTSANIRISVEGSVPLGELLLTVTRNGSTRSIPLRVVNPQPFALDPGTQLLWHVDETTGENVADASPNSVNGTASFSSSIYDGRFGKARSYGITANTNPASLNFGSTDFTIEGWFKSVDGIYRPTRSFTVFTKGDVGNNSEAFVLDFAGGALRARLRDTGQRIWEAKTDPRQVRIADGRWHYVSMVTRRGGTPEENRLLIFVDGIERANIQAPASFGGLRNTTQRFKAGDYAVLADEIRILNFARSAQQTADTWLGTDGSIGRLKFHPRNPLRERQKHVPHPSPDTNARSTPDSSPPGEIRTSSDARKEERR